MTLKISIDEMVHILESGTPSIYGGHVVYPDGHDFKLIKEHIKPHMVKEFLLKCFDKGIIICSFRSFDVFDYDIALAYELCRSKSGLKSVPITLHHLRERHGNFTVSLKSYLTSEEIDKLHTTLQLMGICK